MSTPPFDRVAYANRTGRLVVAEGNGGVARPADTPPSESMQGGDFMRVRRLLAPALVVAILAIGVFAATPVLAGGRPFTTALVGAAEVPTGDPDATGTATVWVNPGTGTVCYSWSVTGAATPIVAAHIHHAPVGVAGPVVVPLPPTGPSSGSGCTTSVDRSLALDIIRNPADYYVNTHNAEFPTGVARGQLSRTP
jgi:hypothetical protein